MAVLFRELPTILDADLTYSSFKILPSAFRLLNFLIMRSATLFSVKTISKVTLGCDFTELHETRQFVPLESNRSLCRADSISASVVPGAKLEACSVNGPALPFMLRPGPVSTCDCCEKPFLVDFAVVLRDEELILAFPLSISLAILEARAELACDPRFDGVVDDGRDGGLNGFFWPETPDDECR